MKQGTQTVKKFLNKMSSINNIVINPILTCIFVTWHVFTDYFYFSRFRVLNF